ncbi:ATP-dependent DNA helicase, partial [Trichonephila clavipes]
MTCNPAWPEITTELQVNNGQTRLNNQKVFKVKVQKLIALLTQRRRAPEDGGHTLAQKTRGGIQEILVDNSWIVPYSPLFSKIFNCHINVEFCNTVKTIKYICKYINKGSDQAIFNIRQQANVNIDPRDEVQTFRAGRYVSNEAAWRILGLPLHDRHPTVIHLAVHLPNGERIYFTENNFRERMATPPKTTLTAFFQLCQNDAFAKTLLYVDVPRYYTWNVSLKEWKRRVQGTHVNGWPGVKAGDALGRIYTVHVSNFECYCLRMLLNVIQGPTNFLDLKTVDGQEFETFRQVCEKLGLLEDDNHWDATMEEAVLCRSPSQIRELFAILICTCGLSNPLQLWDKYKVALSEDILHRFEKMDQVNNDLCLNEALIHIEDKIIRISGKKLSDFGMPTPQRRGELSTDLIKELSYNIALLDTQVSETEPCLLPEQKDIYNKILQRVELAKIRKDRNVALAVASSGIAATLLSGGRTAHSVFKLPLNLASEETPTCNI